MDLSPFISQDFNFLLHTISGWTPDHNMMNRDPEFRIRFLKIQFFYVDQADHPDQADHIDQADHPD